MTSQEPPAPRSEGLVERAAEVAAIDDVLRRAGAGEPGMLVVEGPAGIGKTRLVGELRRRAAAAGLRVCGARGAEMERDFPFGVVRQLLEGPLAGPGRRGRLLAGAAAPAAAVFDGVEAAPRDDGDTSFAILHGLYWLTANLAGDDPLVLVVDDLHWCDRPSLRALAYLARRLDGLPVTLVVSLRPAEPGADAALLAEIATDPLALTLRPAPLSAHGARELIGDRLGDAPADAFADACHGATGGNPLLLTELLRAMRAEGVRPDAGSAGAVRAIGPRAASRAVLVRLARLPAAAVETARAAAVLGEGASLDDVAALSGIPRTETAHALDELARVEILRPGPPVGFVHPLVRAAVYGDLSQADREARHERAARHLAAAGAPADLVASHLLLTPGRGDPWVVETLTAAARRARGRGAPDSAAAYLARALAEPPPEGGRAGLLLDLGTAEAQMHGPSSVDHLHAAYRAATDPVTRATAAQQLGEILFFLGETDEGVRILDEARAALGPGEDDRRDRLVATRLTTALWSMRTAEEVEDVFAPHRRGPRGDHVGGRMLAGVVAYEWAMTGGPGPACVDLARHATGGAGVLSRTVNGSVPYVAALLTLVLADDEGALAATREAFEAAHRAGSLLSASSGRLFHGMALARRGELEEAAELERAAGTDLDAWGFVTVRLFPGSLLAEILVETGDLDGARRALRHANPGDGPMPDNTNSAYWLSSRLRLLVAEGAHREALALAEDCRRRFAGSVVNPAFIPWRSLGAEALHGLGRTEEAVALAAGEVPPARLWGAPGALGRALRVLGTLRGPGDGLPALEEAVAVTAGTPARLEHARALAALGTALRLLRRPSEAREPLRRALETATVCGAAPLAEHARTELHAAGARPRTAALSGAGALTASERRVADLAGGGMSNRDIAQALYVTPKTVEVHLSSTYRKLGIRSRRELGAALAAG